MSSATYAPCDQAIAQSTATTPGNPQAVAILAASILGSSLAFVDGSVVNVALPTLGKALGAGPEGLPWLISAYLLTLSSLILLGGALGDQYGRRRIFAIGVTLFLVASIGCAAAPSLAVFLAARAVQGIGAALLMPNSLAILGASFTGDAKGQAIGTWAGVGALASAIGPVLGGWLVDHVGWPSIFLINLPVGGAALFLALRYVTESRTTQRGSRLDLAGAALVTAALGLLTWALTAAGARAGDPMPIYVAASAGVLLLGLFLCVELRQGKAALMPLYLMRGRSFLGVTLLTFFLYAALGGLIVLLPFVMMRAKGFSAVAAGAAMLPIPLIIGAGSRIMGRVAARIGGRWPLGIGAIVVACGLALYLRVGTDPGGYWGEVFPATALVAIGMAVCVAPLTTTVIASVDDDHVGAASGFNSAVARIGGLFATALVGFVFAAQSADDVFIASAHLAAMVGAATAAFAGLCAITLIQSPPPDAGGGPATARPDQPEPR